MKYGIREISVCIPFSSTLRNNSDKNSKDVGIIAYDVPGTFRGAFRNLTHLTFTVAQ